MRLELIAFKTDHFFQFANQEALPLPVAQRITLGKFYEESGPAYTALLDGTSVACAGMRFIQPGVGEVWAYVSPRVGEVKKEFHTTAKGILEDVIRAFKLRRVQAGILTSAEPMFGRWLRALGFSNPVSLEAWGPNGEDFLMYSIIRR